MGTKKKLPRSRRCRNSEYLGLYCNCEFDDACRRTCCRSAAVDALDCATAKRFSSDSSDKYLYTGPDPPVELDTVNVRYTGENGGNERQLPPHDNHVPSQGPYTGPEFTCLDVLVGLSSICFFYFDVITDCLLARDYYYQNDMLAFGLTTTFIIGPGLVTLLLNVRWYYLDYQSQCMLIKNHGSKRVRATSRLVWAARFLMTICFMSPVMR